MKVTGELYDVYWMQKQDMAELNVLMAKYQAVTGASDEETRAKYQHMFDLHEKESRELWDAICDKFDLPRDCEYMLTKDGSIVLLPEAGEVAS